MSCYLVTDRDPMAATVAARRDDIVGSPVVLRRRPAERADGLRRYRTLAERTAALGDDRLIVLLDATDDDGVVLDATDDDGVVLVHPAPDGPSATDLLAAGTLGPDEAVRLTLSLLDAVDTLHRAGLSVGGIDGHDVHVPVVDGRHAVRLVVVGNRSDRARDVRNALSVFEPALDPPTATVVERLRTVPGLDARAVATALRRAWGPTPTPTPPERPTPRPLVTPAARPRLSTAWAGAAALGAGTLVGAALTAFPR